MMTCGCDPDKGFLCKEAMRLWVNILKTTSKPDSDEAYQARQEWNDHFNPEKEQVHGS